MVSKKHHPQDIGQPPKRRKLSPRDRGSVAPPLDQDRLLGVFAGNVRLLRRSKGLSQEMLGDLSDLDRTYISGIERGLRNVSIRNIQRLAEALNVDARTLLDPHLKSDTDSG